MRLLRISNDAPGRILQGRALLCGGLAESAPINPYDNATMIARALGARCFYLTAPMSVETEEFRDLIVSSEPVRSVLAMVASLDMALLSAIDLSEQSKALEYNVISRKTWASLRAAGQSETFVATT